MLMRRRSPAEATVRDAVDYLASACDGAVRRDGHGFALEHVRTGHRLAARRRWSRRDKRAARFLVRYHFRQLERAGYDVETLLGQVRRSRRRYPSPGPAIWAPDPTGLHVQRLWNGARWTAQTR